MYVVPKSGLNIPDPDMGDFLPAEGRNVPETAYWLRRIKEKSVFKGSPTAKKTPAKSTTPETVPESSGSDA